MTCPHLGNTDQPHRIGLIIEGICPTCVLPLEVRGDHGWCACCEAGWATSNDGVTLDISVKGPAQFE